MILQILYIIIYCVNYTLPYDLVCQENTDGRCIRNDRRALPAHGDVRDHNPMWVERKSIMKKIVSLVMVLVLVSSFVFSFPVSAAKVTATITTGSGNSRTFEVGQEFVYTVGLYAGEELIANCQDIVEFDSDIVEIVDYYVEEEVDKEEYDVEDYHQTYSYPNFCSKVDVVSNIKAAPGLIKFNFTKAKGVAVFNDADKVFARFHFRVKAEGSATISNTVLYMQDKNSVNIYHNKTANETVAPYDKETLMLATIIKGDINLDGAVNAKDARILSRYIANWDGYADMIVEREAALLDKDASITAKDARILSRIAANWDGYRDTYVKTITR